MAVAFLDRALASRMGGYFLSVAAGAARRAADAGDEVSGQPRAVPVHDRGGVRGGGRGRQA